MESTRIKYEAIKKRITANDEKIHHLLSNKKVQDYLNLIKENEELIKEFTKISPKYEFNRMKNCSHIYLINNVPRINTEFETYDVNSYYCPKCQLDTYYKNNHIDNFSLTIPQREMWNLFIITKENARFIDCRCTPTQADEIYERIINEYPNISDDELIKSLKEALSNMIETSETQVKNLTLRPGYKKI